MGGTTEPAALVTMESIGCINEPKNAEYSSAIFQLLQGKGIKIVARASHFVIWNDPMSL